MLAITSGSLELASTPNVLKYQYPDFVPGHAVEILRKTMPDFFVVGLVSRAETDPSGASIYAPNVRLSYSPPTPLPPPFPATLHVEGVSSSRPDPASSHRLLGIPLYHASAVFVRHTLATLYSDLRAELRSFSVVNTGSRQRHVRLGIGVQGQARVTHNEAQWDV